MPQFQLEAKYKTSEEQQKVIADLSSGLNGGVKDQTLVGVTASGKTFVMANVIANMQKPTLVLAHNKTLAAQLFAEFRTFFPKNAVKYFVSYYDYYQPEAIRPLANLTSENTTSVVAVP